MASRVASPGVLSSSLLLAATVAVLLAFTARADLPVHCLNVQIVGDWVFEMSDDSNDNSLRCGHHVPDTNADHFTKHGYDLDVVTKYRVTLKDPNVAVDEHGTEGTWTMVYDEGFEVVIGGKKFFAFSKYVPKTPESLQKDDVEDYTSVCDETLVGWFHNVDGSHWGCYHGKRVGGQRVSVDSSGPLTSDHVVSPSFRFAEERAAGNADAERADDTYRRMSFKDVEETAMWEPNYSFIEAVNQNEQSLWRAGVNRGMLGSRMKHLMKLLGGREHLAAHRHQHKHHKHVLEQAAHYKHKRPRHKGRHQRAASHPVDLPEAFDWRNKEGVNFDSPIKNQGNCGSCYAMASIYVAESRLRIMTKNKRQEELSTQAVVSCSVYNQGCDGGYPYLVAKHAEDFGLVLDQCMSYQASDEKCGFSDAEGCGDHPVRYFATNYSYIGGYYGSCTEEAMMREIYERGPIMVAFDAPSSLFYYSGGIYTGDAPPHEGPRLPELHPWEKTNHAVVAVGWGFVPATATKPRVNYWIIKNTWGADWGEHGYFRIRRGTDECGIESMAVTMDLVLPKEAQL